MDASTTPRENFPRLQTFKLVLTPYNTHTMFMTSHNKKEHLFIDNLFCLHSFVYLLPRPSNIKDLFCLDLKVLN